MKHVRRKSVTVDHRDGDNDRDALCDEDCASSDALNEVDRESKALGEGETVRDAVVEALRLILDSRSHFSILFKPPSDDTELFF